jgi:hypothetical protein
VVALKDFFIYTLQWHLTPKKTATSYFLYLLRTLFAPVSRCLGKGRDVGEGKGEEGRRGGGEEGEEGKRGSMRYNVSLVRLLGLANAVAGVVEVEGLVIVLGAA